MMTQYSRAPEVCTGISSRTHRRTQWLQQPSHHDETNFLSKRRETRDEVDTAQSDRCENSKIRSGGFSEYERMESPYSSQGREKNISTHKRDQATKTGQKEKEGVEKRAEISCPNDTYTQRQNSSFTEPEFKTFCDTLDQSIKAGNLERFHSTVKKYEDRSWPLAVNEDEFIAHPGYKETLEDIRLSFQLDYVDKKLHMVGYFEDSGSDLYLMVDDDGKVYRAEGDILYVVENSLHDYMTHGSKDLGHYDYYGRLSSKKSLDCIGWNNRKEEDKLCSSSENDENFSDESGGEADAIGLVRVGSTQVGLD
ncbi:uncharacterized protein [Ptychodera flava]|uniref:uncharacterized protein isoform X2 n=1 Tax=Ptychodera flava TaxID=63121 RepID=UPI00396A6C71